MALRRMLAGALMMALGLPSIAGINAFTATGPDGAATYDIEFAAGGALLATTTRSIYRSIDNGASWTRTRQVENWGPNHLSVNPANRDQVLFGAGTELARSADGGTTWAVIPNLPQLQTNGVGFVGFSQDGSIAWMAQQNGGTLYRSTDAGATWTSIDTGLTHPIISIAVDQANPQLLYLRSASGSFVSSNGGSTLTPLGFTPYVGAFAASRTTANTVLASSSDNYRFYLSTNGGTTWTTTAWVPVPGRQMGLIEYVPGTAGKAIAMDDQFQMLRTLDDGQQWTDLGPAPNGQIYSIAFHPSDPTHIFLATFGGIFESTDDGATWAERNSGLREGLGRSVVVSRGGTGATYLQSWDLGSVYLRAADTGAWTAVGRATTPLLGRPASLSSTFGYTALGVSHQNPQRVYMAREQKFGVSNDGGVSWTLRSAVADMQTMEVSPTNDQVIMLGSNAHSAFRSTDGGASWQDLGSHGLPSGARHFAFDPTNTNVVYAAVDNYVPPAATAIYKSVDGGANFAPGPWNAAHNPSIVWRLVHDPTRPNIVYLSAYHGLYKTTDGGATWTHQPLFNDTLMTGGATDLIIDPQSPEILYASGYGRPWIARSVNGGASWDMVRESFALETFQSIALVPGTRNKIIAVRWAGMREIDFAAKLVLTVPTALVTANTPVSSVLTLANPGEFAASAVRLTATLPASSTTHTVQTTAGTCAIVGLALNCEVGILPASGQATVTVSYTPTAAGLWSPTATAYEPDDNAVDNTTQVVVREPAPPPSNGGGSGGGGGGGGLDYLLLAFLFFTLVRTPPLRRHYLSCASALKRR